MDTKILTQLQQVAQLMHEQDSAKLNDVQDRLRRVEVKCAELQKRSGEVVGGVAGDSLLWQAQAMWSNSSEIEMVALEKEIQKLESEVLELIKISRASFAKVQGLDSLVETYEKITADKAAKKEELTQQEFVTIKRLGHKG